MAKFFSISGTSKNKSSKKVNTKNKSKKILIPAMFFILFAALGLLLLFYSRAATNTLTFAPIADGFVHAGVDQDKTVSTLYPTELMAHSKTGTCSGTPCDGSQDHFSYLKFSVKGIATAKVTSVKLRIKVKVGSGPTTVTGSGGNISLASNNWTENDITFNTRPDVASNPILASKNNVASETFVDFILPTSSITKDGIYSFKISSSDAHRIIYYSKESSAANAAKLIIQTFIADTTVTVNISQPVNGSVLKDTSLLQATLSGAANGVEFYANNSKIGNGTKISSTVYQLNWNTQNLAIGNYNLSARVKNTSGVVSASKSISVSKLFLDGIFPISTGHQPIDSFTKWKARGINTVWNHPAGSDLDAWVAAANGAGLYQIRKPRSNASQDIGEKLLLAWAQRDEPDNPSKGLTPQDQIDQYNAWKAIDPNRKVIINFIGFLNQVPQATYVQWMTAGDFISGDFYPVNNQTKTVTINRGGLFSNGWMIDTLQSWSGNKPTFAHLETGIIGAQSWQTIGPTPDQLRAEIWDTIIHGARGISYFPLHPLSPGFSFDNTPANVVAELTKQSAIITQHAQILQNEIDPASIGATTSTQLEVSWRNTPTGKYFFVLNKTNQNLTGQVITLTGVNASVATVVNENRAVTITSSKFTDSFGPYTLHIYKVD